MTPRTQNILGAAFCAASAAAICAMLLWAERRDHPAPEPPDAPAQRAAEYRQRLAEYQRDNEALMMQAIRRDLLSETHAASLARAQQDAETRGFQRREAIRKPQVVEYRGAIPVRETNEFRP